MNPTMNFSYHANKERSSKIHPTNLIFEPLKVATQYKDLLKNATINEEGIIKLDLFYICEPKNRVIIIHPAVNNINIIDVSRLYFTHYGKQMFQEIEKEDTISSLKYIFNPTYLCKTIKSIEYHGNTYENIIYSWSDTWINRFECCITDSKKRDSLIHEHLCHRYIPINYGVFGSEIPSQMCVGLNQIYNPNTPTTIFGCVVYSTAKIEYEKFYYKELEDMVKEQKIMIDEMTRKQKEIEQEKEQLKILEKKRLKVLEKERFKILEKERLKKNQKLEEQRKIDLEKKIRRQLKDEEEIEQIKMKLKQENKTVTTQIKQPSKIDDVLIGVNKLSSNVKSNNRELIEVMKLFTENICDCIIENK